MSVAEYIYNLLSTGYPNRVYYDFFEQNVNLQSTTGLILVRNMQITGEDTKTGPVADTHEYRIEIVGAITAKLALLNLSLAIRQILTAVSTSDIYRISFDNQVEIEQSAAENMAEVTRVIQTYTVYLHNANTI